MAGAEAKRLLIKGGRVYDPVRDLDAAPVADILIEGAEIVEIRPAGAPSAPPLPGPAPRVVDAAGRLVMAGFVNAHYHSADVLLKGFFEPSPLELWVLNALPRSYGPRSVEEVRVRTLLGALECIRGGMTTVQDMVSLVPLSPAHVEAVLRAYDEAGIRCILGLQVANVSPMETVPYWRETIPAELHGLIDNPPAVPGPRRDPVAAVEEALLAWRGGFERIVWALAPSSPERCTIEMLERIAALSERHALPVYSHVYISKAEALNARQRFAAHGGSLIRFLKSVGLLGPRLTLAHGVWLLPEEIDAMAEAGASLVSNPISNLKNKNGVAPIRRLIEAGVNIALGCDNCSCSDVQNMFQAMKFLALLAAVADPEPGPPDARHALQAATVGGARTAGLDGRIGALRPGMKADIAILDLGDPTFVPLNSIGRQLVYAESGRSVETVIVDGRVVMENRVIKTVDEAALREAVADAMKTFRPDAEAVVARHDCLTPYILEADRRIWAHDVGVRRYIGH